MSRRHPAEQAFLEPLSPQRKWRAITIATVLLAPAMWSLLAGVVAVASDSQGGPAPGPAIAFGLSMIPFVFVVLAFASQHPSAPSAAFKAMAMCLLVGIPVSALAADAVSGIVAGIGAGGVYALRSEAAHSRLIRFGAVAIATAYTFMLVRLGGAVALIAAPILPFTGLGVADHYAEWRLARQGRVQSTSHTDR